MYQIPGLNKFPELVHGISTVDEGNMSIKWGPEAEVNQNRQNFLNKLNIDPNRCIHAGLVNAVDYRVVDNTNVGTSLICDALITKDLNLPLRLVTADCFPTIVYDPHNKYLALVHLGIWGVAGGLATKVVNELTSWGSDPSSLILGIGPGVFKSSYKFEREVLFQKDLPEWQAYLQVDPNDEMTMVDSHGYLLNELQNLGVNEENIYDSGINTVTDSRFFSHYRSVRTGEPEGRFMTVVMLKNH